MDCAVLRSSYTLGSLASFIIQCNDLSFAQLMQSALSHCPVLNHSNFALIPPLNPYFYSYQYHLSRNSLLQSHTPSLQPSVSHSFQHYLFPQSSLMQLWIHLPSLPPSLACSFSSALTQSLLPKTLTQSSTTLCSLYYVNMRKVPDRLTVWIKFIQEGEQEKKHVYLFSFLAIRKIASSWKSSCIKSTSWIGMFWSLSLKQFTPLYSQSSKFLIQMLSFATEIFSANKFFPNGWETWMILTCKDLLVDIFLTCRLSKLLAFCKFASINFELTAEPS